MLDLYCITGPPRSGKSAFLRHLASQPDFPRDQAALLINDISPLQMEAKLFRGKARVVWTLASGCVCCEGGQELSQTLRKLTSQTDLQQIWLEASGVASTEDLVDQFQPWIVAKQIRLRWIIRVIDVSQEIPSLLENARLFVLNKIDLASPPDLEKWHRRIGHHYPRALRLEARHGAVDFGNA